MYLVWNSTITVTGAFKPDDSRGNGLDFVVIDEAAGVKSNLSIAGTTEAIVINRTIGSPFPAFVCAPFPAVHVAFITPVIVKVARLRHCGSENRHTAR